MTHTHTHTHTRTQRDPRIDKVLDTPVRPNQPGLQFFLRANGCSIVSFTSCVLGGGFTLVCSGSAVGHNAVLRDGTASLGGVVSASSGGAKKSSLGVMTVMFEGCTFHLAPLRNVRPSAPIQLTDSNIALIIDAEVSRCEPLVSKRNSRCAS